MDIKGAPIIDFTGTIAGAQKHERFSDVVTETIRRGSSRRMVVVVDSGFSFKNPAPHLVSDHLNFTGSNPLLGPNHPCGERFPVLNGIYVIDSGLKALGKLPKGVLCGLKLGVIPTAAEEAKLRSLGAEFFSYNLTQAMIIAAHAGLKVLGIVVPNDEVLDAALVAELQAFSDQERG